MEEYAPAKRSKHTLLVQAEQVRTMYSQLPRSTFMVTIAATVSAVMFWSPLPHLHIVIWYLFLVANQASRFALFFAFRRANPAPEALPRWGRYWSAGGTLSGVVWGAGGLILFVPGSTEYQAILLALLVGVMFGGAVLNAHHKPTLYSFSIPVLLPMIARLLGEGGSTQILFAVIEALVLVTILMFGHNFNRVLTESIARRFENVDLVDELQEQTRFADAARHVAEAATRAKSQFFAAASHDLRQPLHALGLFAAALLEKTREPEALEVVRSINDSVEVLENLFAELLDVAKIDAGAIQPNLSHIQIAPLMARLKLDADPSANDKGLQMRVRPSHLWVHTDPLLLERILRNLISNAIRYTDHGGVLIAARRRGDRVRFEVWDTGTGIPEAEYARIFEEFYQSGNPGRHSKKGLGLGLSIVQRLAGLLGYPVRLHSVVGKGSVFSIEVPLGHAVLPQVQATGMRTATTTPTTSDVFANRLVAVIDDEDTILKGMQTLLAGWGLEVAVGHDADETLERLGELGRYPDLLIVDFRLQEGLTGVQAIQRLRNELGADIPALLVTGSTSAAHAIEAEQHGYQFLTKPVMPAKLRAMVELKLKEAESTARP